MHDNSTPSFIHIKGNTWCIVTHQALIPLYKLGNGQAVMIDSGLDNPDRDGILQLLKSENLRVRAVLTSHAHIDHTGNHNTLRKLHGAEIYMTPFDAAISGNSLALKTYMTNMSYETLLRNASSMFCETDHYIDCEKPFLHIEGARFGVISLPGHAPEHLAFVTPDGVAYLGDALMAGDYLEHTKIPYMACCQLDFESKARMKSFAYPQYIIAHHGICTQSELPPLVERNISILNEKIAVVEGIATQYVTAEDLIAKTTAVLGLAPNNLLKLSIAAHSIQMIAEYLMDTGRFLCRAQNGYVQYIQADKA